jgi:hypothetical protein
MRCNIRQDLAITVAQDSWMPRTETQKQVGLQTFLALTAQIIAAKAQTDPKILDEVLRRANEIYGGGIDFNDFQKDATEAQLRLDKLREVGEFVESQFGPMLYDPMTGAPTPDAIVLAFQQTAELLRLTHIPDESGADIFAALPLDVMFDNHPEFQEAYTDWLNTADGRAASLFVRTLVHELAVYHVQAVERRNMKMKEYQNVGMLPDLEAGLVADQAANDQALANAAQQKEQEMLYGAVQNLVAPPPAEGQGANQ